MSLLISGTDNYLSHASPFNHNGPYTAMGWIYVSSNTGTYQHFFHVGGPQTYDANTDTLGLDFGGLTFRMGCAGGSGNSFLTGTVLSLNTWYHIALVRASATSLIAYLDGVSDITATPDVSGRTAASNLFIGQYNNLAMHGRLAGWQIYTAALTPEEIRAQSYSLMPVRWANLWAYYPMLDATSREIDYSGGARNLTVVGTLATIEDNPPVSVFASFGGQEQAFTTAGGAHTIAVSQVTETDTAQAITVNPKRRLVNQTTETDLAQALTKRKTLAVGQATETDAAQTLTVRKALAIGQTTETDSAQAITARKTRILVQVSETDLAQPITRSTPGTIIVPVGQVAETDQAQPITVNPRRRLISPATESDQAQPLTARKLQTLGIAIESDLAQAIARHKVKALGQALETDLALAVSWNPMRRFVGQALELDEALAIGVVHGEQIPVLILPATTRVYRIDARARLFVLRVTK